MLDVNLHTLNFVRSTNEPDKLFLIDESTGDPAYFRLKVPEGTESRIELYHAPTLAPLGVFQHLSSKLKLIALTNPETTVELKNSGYIHFEWTFYFDKILKFCWRKDIVGLAGNKRGFTCWMSRKPDPDYPCAIYRPGSSTVPPFCQFLDFNIRRIDGLQDPHGLKYVIMLSLLGFTEVIADHETHRTSTESPPRSQNKLAPAMTSNVPTTEANELWVSEHRSTSELATQGLKLFEDPLLLYISVYASSPKDFKQAISVAEQIKRDRLKKSGEELQQYLVDDIISQEMAEGSSFRPTNLTSNSLRIYLSRTPLDELLPKSATKTNSGKSSKSSLSLVAPKSSSSTRQLVKPLIPPKEQRQGLPTTSSSTNSTNNSLHSRLMIGVHRPFNKMKSIANNSTRSNGYDQDHITPYCFDEEEEEGEEETPSRVMEVQGDQVQTTLPLRLQNQLPVVSEIEYRPVSKNLPYELPTCKKPAPFLICSNELNSTNRLTEKPRVLVKRRSHNNNLNKNNLVSNEVRAEKIPYSLEQGNKEESVSSEGDARNSVTIASSSESIRSRSSTIKSTASSFVEIILSSCCSAYSTTFNSVPSAIDRHTPHRKYHNRNSRRRDVQSANSAHTWKRLSHLFSSKLDSI